MTLHLHALKGCSPAPLAHYLKALGILRLIVEQGADREARGWWQDECFCLLSTLSRDQLESSSWRSTNRLRSSRLGTKVVASSRPMIQDLHHSRTRVRLDSSDFDTV